MIRKVRTSTVATRIGPILDAFEELGWPTVMDSPIPGDIEDQKLRLKEAVSTLNKDLPADSIRFGRINYEEISWEDRSTPFL